MLTTVYVLSSLLLITSTRALIPLHPAKCTGYNSVCTAMGENSSHSLLLLSHFLIPHLTPCKLASDASCLMKQGFPRSAKRSKYTGLFSSVSFHDLCSICYGWTLISLMISSRGQKRKKKKMSWIHTLFFKIP